MVNDSETADSRWKVLYKAAGVAAFIMVILIVVQSVVFVVFPPPSTVEGYFSLFQNNWLIGLLDLDLIYIIISALMILIYLALYVALRQANQSLVTIALAISLVSTAVYFTSRTSFEMLSLSSQYANATTDAQRTIFLSAGQAALATYSGTAFDVYYILSAIALLLFSFVMLQSNVFSKVISYLGILAGALMLVPSTAGTIGLIFAFASLVPWAIWLVLFARRLFRLQYRASKEAVNQI